MNFHMASRSTAEATLAKQFAEQEAREPSLVRRAITLPATSPLNVTPVSVVSTPAVPAPSPIG